MAEHEYFTTDENGNVLTISPIDKICKILKRKIEDYEYKIEYYQKKIKEL